MVSGASGLTGHLVIPHVKVGSNSEPGCTQLRSLEEETSKAKVKMLKIASLSQDAKVNVIATSISKFPRRKNE
jgi:hypothetical protein